jgi:hypothetical protein
MYVAWMNGNLVVCLHWIDLGVKATTREVMEVIVDVTNGISVGNGSSVKSSVVTAWTRTVSLLGYDMEPKTRNSRSVELGFGDGEPVRCQSPWSAGDW